MSEGVVVDYDTVECLGERYRIGDKIGLMPLMRFAHSAKQGVDSGDLEGLSAPCTTCSVTASTLPTGTGSRRT
jgi:hypothetical protein